MISSLVTPGRSVISGDYGEGGNMISSLVIPVATVGTSYSGGYLHPHYQVTSDQSGTIAPIQTLTLHHVFEVS